jgi:predicted lactoylglutathione lyase
MDRAFMYGRSFYDLENHQWEVLWLKSNGRSFAALTKKEIER